MDDRDQLQSIGKRGRGRPRTVSGGGQSLGKPVSVYLSDATKESLAARGAARSEVLRAVVARYDAVVRACLPELPPDVWRIVFDAHRRPSAASRTPRGELMTDVANAVGDEMDGADQARLLDRLSKLDEPQAAAALDLAERYWTGDAEAQRVVGQLLDALSL